MINCPVGMLVNPNRIAIVIGAVNGKKLKAMASGLLGFWMKVLIKK